MTGQTYTLAEVRDGTGWPKDARFALVPPAKPRPMMCLHESRGGSRCVRDAGHYEPATVQQRRNTSSEEWLPVADLIPSAEVAGINRGLGWTKYRVAESYHSDLTLLWDDEGYLCNLDGTRG
jgi:hypothetical protein